MPEGDDSHKNRGPLPISNYNVNSILQLQIINYDNNGSISHQTKEQLVSTELPTSKRNHKLTGYLISTLNYRRKSW